MKISTAQFFRTNAEALSKGQYSVSDLQAKLGSGKQITSPSQDVQKANLISRLESNISSQKIYKENIEVAMTRLTSEETALTSITEVFQRASELAILGANGTMAAEDRAVLGAEVTELKKELIRLANSRDIDGNYLFGGNRIESPPFLVNEQGVTQYVGDYSRLSIRVSDSRTMDINTLGSELLTPDDFAAIESLEAGLISNNLAEVRSSIDVVKTSSDRLSVSFGRLGARMATLNSQAQLQEDTTVRLETVLSGHKDLDYAKAITELSQESLALQALQASFTKISQLSLFNYLR